MRSTTGLLAQWAEAAGPALFFELALALLAATPGAGELPADTHGAQDFQQPCPPASAVLGEPPGEVRARAEIMSGVLIGPVEVQQVHGHAAPPMWSWSGTSCACSRRSRLQCCV